MDDFASLQRRLERAWAANRPGADADHVVVVLPAHSVAETLMAHYGPRIRALEHRYLVPMLMLHRFPTCELVYLCSQAPEPEVLAYYASLGPGGAEVLDRLRVVAVEDARTRSISAKLLDRPDLLAELRASWRGRPAYLQPWNVTELEVEVALALDTPLLGTPPKLRPLAFKSAGRRLFAACGVPVPFGCEDVHTVDDVLAAIAKIRVARPDTPGVVVKHDDSCAGDGNVVIGLRSASGAPASDAALRERVEALPEWYLADLAAGGVVEELVSGSAVSSPSAQVQIDPDGSVTVLATHEQVLGGDSGQVFTGCAFPADPAYAPELAVHAAAVGRALAEHGALGRLAVDFIAVRREDGASAVHALEINLRNGGTTHPYAALRHLVPGRYDSERGCWVSADGSARAYSATDNLIDVAWLGLPPGRVIAAVASAGLQFDPRVGTGVVLHMLSGLAVDGRFGLTAIGRDPAEAAGMHQAARAAVAALV